MKKLFKPILAILAVVAITVASVPVAFAENFAGYNRIETKEQLNSIRDGLNAKYYLANDIVFTEADFAEGGAFYNGGKGWEPLGISGNNAFTGVIDGNGYSIKGLKVNCANDGTAFVGFIGYNQGEIRNLSIEEASVTVDGGRYTYAAILCGASSKNSITGCFVSGEVSVKNNSISCNIGGIVGGHYSGSISYCLNAANINVAECSHVNVGGVTGDMQSSSKVMYCGNKGNITAEGKSDVNAGGICGGGAGSNYSGASISDVYNVGAVSISSKCDSYGGGIVGKNKGTVERAFNAGQVAAYANTFFYPGTVAGMNVKGASVSNSYYVAETSSEGDGVIGLTKADAANKASFVNFNFDGVWAIVDGLPVIEKLTQFLEEDVEAVKPVDPPEEEDEENIATDGVGDKDTDGDGVGDSNGGIVNPTVSNPSGSTQSGNSNNGEGTQNVIPGNEIEDPFAENNVSEQNGNGGKNGFTWAWVVSVVVVVLAVLAFVIWFSVKKGFIRIKRK